MSQQEPEYVWSFPPEKKRHPGRVWLIVGLSVAAVAIAVVLFLLFIPRGTPVADPTGTPTASASPSPSASPSETPTATPTETSNPTEPAEPPVQTAPPPPPDLSAFRQQVAPWLDGANTGLDIISENDGHDVGDVIEVLQQDQQRMAGAAVPGSIAKRWNAAVAEYGTTLDRLNVALGADRNVDSAVSGARDAVTALRAIVGE